MAQKYWTRININRKSMYKIKNFRKIYATPKCNSFGLTSLSKRTPRGTIIEFDGSRWSLTAGNVGLPNQKNPSAGLVATNADCFFLSPWLL